MRLTYVISIFAALIGACLVCIALLPILISSIDAAASSAAQQSTSIHAGVVREVTANIATVGSMTQLFITAFEQRGIYLPRDEIQVAKMIRKVVQQTPAIEFITFGTNFNDALEVDGPGPGGSWTAPVQLKIKDQRTGCRTTYNWTTARDTDLSKVLKVDCTYNPLKRVWFGPIAAVTTSGEDAALTSTPPTVSFTAVTLDYYIGRQFQLAASAINKSEPVLKNAGVVAATLSTGSLSSLLRGFTLSARGVLALLDIGLGQVVALSSSETAALYNTTTGLILGLKNTSAIENPYIRAALTQVDALKTNAIFNGTIATNIEYDRLTLIVRAQDVAFFNGSLNLRVLLVTPQEDYTDPITASRNVAIIVVVCVSVALLAVQLAVFARLLQPLNDISERMQDLAVLDTDVAEIQAGEQSAMSEIQAIQSAYSSMRSTVVSFVRYVPKEVVLDLMMAGSVAEIGMEQRECTVMFVDIESFTHLTESMSHEQLAVFMETYYNCQTAIVMQHGGTIDKFIGDAIMAMWGAPADCDLQDLKAVTTGMRLRDEIHTVLPHVNIRVGIAAGMVLAGNMGGRDRISYTVVGDVVNTASRIEALNKEFRTRVMITDAVHASVKGSICTRLLGAVKVYGKEKPTLVYEAVGVLHNPSTAASPQSNTPSASGSHRSARTGKSSARVTIDQDRLRRAKAKANKNRRVLTNETELLEATARATVAVAPADAKFAEAFTDAVQSFIQGNFIEAADRFAACCKGRQLGSGTALMIELCNEFTARGRPMDFDGSIAFGK